MATKSRLYEGNWRTLTNLAASSAGSIHSDERARELGFQRGFVPGVTISEAVMPAIIDRFGRQFVEGGWYHIKFTGPVYEDEEVREVAEPINGGDAIQVYVETREGRVTSLGEAGLGTGAPWNVAEDGTKGADTAFPKAKMGDVASASTITVTAEEALRQLDTAGNMVPWFRGQSPWGGAVVPWCLINGPRGMPEWQQDEHVEAAAIYAEFWELSLAPMFQGQEYSASSKLVDKGLSGRTWYSTVEFEIKDKGGASVFVGRRKTKFLVKQS